MAAGNSITFNSAITPPGWQKKIYQIKLFYRQIFLIEQKTRIHLQKKRESPCGNRDGNINYYFILLGDEDENLFLLILYSVENSALLVTTAMATVAAPTSRYR